MPRRKPYIRPETPQPMRLTARDRRILETIHAFDGVLSLKQIDRCFFSGHGRSQPRARMRLLFDHGYVAMPSPADSHRVPLGETVYWLDRAGAAVVAGLQGLPPRHFRWRRKPRYAQLDHSLAVNDFRLNVQDAVGARPDLALTGWVPESEFLVQPDAVHYRGAGDRKRTRRVRPDGFFAIQQAERPYPFAFLLEIDRGTEDNPRFGREKVRPGVAYLRSDAFRQRFGVQHARYLVVTTGQRRLRNLMAQAERGGGAGLFYFTTFSAVCCQTVLDEPIWWLAGQPGTRRIVP